MKNEIPPWVAVGIVIVVVLVAVFFLYRGTGPGRQAKEMEDIINASAAKPGGKTLGGVPAGLSGAAPAAQPK